MRKAFHNSSQLECIFTDRAVVFYGPQQEVSFPFTCLDTIKMSLFGILQASHRSTVCSFAVDRQDRAAVRELIKKAREVRNAGPQSGRPCMIDLTRLTPDQKVSSELPPEEQLKSWKALFVQGVLSREEYEIKKLRLRQD